MTFKNKVILVGSGKNNQEKLSTAIAQSGFSVLQSTFASLAETLKTVNPSDIMIFNIEDINELISFEQYNKLAGTIKSNPATSTVRILMVGINIHLLDEPTDHIFDDLLFGAVRIPSIVSRLKSQTRLNTMQAELQRRHTINEKYNITNSVNNEYFSNLNDASVLVTGRPNGYSRIEETLSPFVTLTGALSGKAAMDYLDRQRYDMLIINGGRNPTQFLDFVHQIRKNTSLYTLPILLVAHPSKLSDSHIAYETGITDIIEAPVNKNELILRVNALIKERRFISAMAKTYLEARHTPTNDSLTGLYTYSYFREHLDAIIQDHYENDRKFSLLTITIENIETINEQHGFSIGDKVLRQVSEILMSVNRGEDLLSRISGRKFVLTLPDTNAKQAINVVQRVEGILKQTQFICDTDCKPMSVTVAAEITESDNEKSAKDLLNKNQSTPPQHSQINAA